MRRAVVFIACIIVFVPVSSLLGLGDGAKTALMWWTLHSFVQADSWMPMIAAFHKMTGGDTGRIYDVFFHDQIKFQYPPSSLLPLSFVTALGGEPSARLFNMVSWAGVLVTGAAVFAIAWIHLAAWCGPQTPAGRTRAGQMWAGQTRGGRLLVAGAFAMVTLVFYPVTKAFALGQVQAWINALFALSCLCWITNRKALAGLLIGAICLLKPQFGLFVPWAIVARQWRFLFSWAVTFGLGTGLSVALYGWANQIDYLNVLRQLSLFGESFERNNSVNGLVNRMLFNGSNVDWRAGEFPPFNPIVYGATLLSSLVLIGVALAFRFRGSERGSILDFCTAALTFTMASPIAWDHHYGILAPIFTILFFAIAGGPQGERRRLIALGTCVLLSAFDLTITRALADTTLNVVQSYLFFGALGCLALLYDVRWGLGLAMARDADPVSGTAAVDRVGRAPMRPHLSAERR